MRIRKVYGRIACLLWALSAMTGISYGQNETTVYLDVSKSMRAYLPSTHMELNTYQSLLLKLSSILVGAGSEKNSIKTVGGQVSPLKSIAALGAYANIKSVASVYTENETNLVGALEDILRTPQSLCLLVTDAVLSRNAQGVTYADCLSGYDLGCFMAKFNEIIDKNRVVWVIGLNSWFQGTYYSEELKMKGATDTRIPAANGLLRPFYIFLVGSDRSRVEDFIKGLKSWFADSYGGNSKGLLLKTIKITPYQVPNLAIQSDWPEMIMDDRNVAVFARTGGGVSYRSTGRKMKGDHAHLVIEMAIEGGDLIVDGIDLLSHFAVRADLEFAPEIKKGEHFIMKEDDWEDGKKRIHVYLSSGFMGALKPRVVLRSSLRLSLQEKETRIWSEWSTLNDSLEENLGKTFNISPLLDYLIKRSLQKAVQMSPQSATQFSVSFSK